MEKKEKKETDKYENIKKADKYQETTKQMNKQTNITTNLKNHFIQGSCLDAEKE